MSQTKTGDIFKEIGGKACFVGEKVERCRHNTNITLNLFRILYEGLNSWVFKCPVGCLNKFGMTT
jgi:hypothetical protein